MRGWRLGLIAIATGLILWQMRTPSYPRPLYPVREPGPPAELGGAYDPARCGTILGTVVWAGEVPVVPPIEFAKILDPPGRPTREPNPNAPLVRDGRVGGALVYLTGVDLHRSRPWDLPPVSVRIGPSRLAVVPGGPADRLGVVTRGAPVEFRPDASGPPSTALPAWRSVRGRGAAFFTQMLPAPDRSVARRVPGTGMVELSAGAAPCWLRGYLFVTDHPYAVVTAADGSFELKGVPDGDYELASWVPNWHVDRYEHDPEMFSYEGPARLFFRPAVEKRQRVSVVAGRPVDVSVSFAASDFGR